MPDRTVVPDGPVYAATFQINLWQTHCVMGQSGSNMYQYTPFSPILQGSVHRPCPTKLVPSDIAIQVRGTLTTQKTLKGGTLRADGGMVAVARI